MVWQPVALGASSSIFNFAGLALVIVGTAVYFDHTRRVLLREASMGERGNVFRSSLTLND